MATPIVESVTDADMRAYLDGLHAMGRLGLAEEVAALVALLSKRCGLVHDRCLLPRGRRLYGSVKPTRLLTEERALASG